MKIFVIGASNSGKTPFAKRVAEYTGAQHIGASEWFRAHMPAGNPESPQAFVEDITRFSCGVLRQDPDANVRYLRGRYDLEYDCVIEGVRNPRDFIHLFDPRIDLVVFLECRESAIPPTVFEGGIDVIRAYLEHAGASGLLGNPELQIRAYRCERFLPDGQAPAPRDGWHPDLDSVIADFIRELPKSERRAAPAVARIHQEIAPLHCAVRQEYLYDMDPTKAGPLVSATAFAVSSYAGSVPTLNVLLADGSMFSFLPPEALVDPKRFRPEEALDPEDLSYQNCADGKICAQAYAMLAGTVQAYFKRRTLWMQGSYVLTIDWYEGNALLHLVALENGQFAFLPSHKVKFGEKAERAFAAYRKMRRNWSV